MSVDARPPGVSLESIIIHDGPSCADCKRKFASMSPLQHADGEWRLGGPRRATYQLIEALCGSQTSGTSSNYQHIDVAEGLLVNTTVRH